MSVYDAESAVNLRKSIESVLMQDLAPKEFVLVVDGPVSISLEEVINSFPSLKTVRLPVNSGLGEALNIGLQAVTGDIVARMDSDDIAFPARMRKQFLKISEGLDIVSAPVLEFSDEITEITGRRDLPVTSEEIREFSKKRNPFNHPCVMFRKSAVLSAGGYSSDYPLFEDYDLWVRMLMNGAKAENLSEPLLYMRSGEGMYLRRGGREYARTMLDFHKSLLDRGWTTKKDFITGALPHALVCECPEFIRRAVYRRLHQKRK